MTLPEIGMLWVGPELSWLEQLCLKSFVDAGHTVNLFAYDKIGGVPDGVTMCNASDIMPAESIMRHANTGSPAYHADIFRLHLMAQTDMIWADTDAYCVQPWRIDPTEPFYGWIADDVPQVNNGVLRLPKDSATLAFMTEFASDPYPIPPWTQPARQEELRAAKAAGQGVHVTELPWGVLGPNLLTHALIATGEIEHAREKHVIYPIPFRDTAKMFVPSSNAELEARIKPDTLSIHLWGRRFRNSAAKRAGRPDPNSTAGKLCAHHGIDPELTRHLMNLKIPSGNTITSLPEDIDTSMFRDEDVANVILQRPGLIVCGPAVRAWEKGNSAPLLELAREARQTVMVSAQNQMCSRCDLFVPTIDETKPARVADIGCGYAIASLVLYHRYQCDVVLIDIEDAFSRHLGSKQTGVAYDNLSTARAFLEANGVPADKITTINPLKQDIKEAGTVDLAFSFRSCGILYPAETYADFFRDQVAPQGQIVLEILKGSGGVPTMKRYGALKVLERQQDRVTILVQKQTETA